MSQMQYRIKRLSKRIRERPQRLVDAALFLNDVTLTITIFYNVAQLRLLHLIAYLLKCQQMRRIKNFNSIWWNKICRK